MRIRSTKATPAERFWDHVATSDDCWLFQGGIFKYGQFGDNGRKVLAHRFAVQLVYPELDASLCVLHTCDHPRCVRNTPTGTYVVDDKVYLRFGHLFLATQGVNNRDMALKGRAHGPQVQPWRPPSAYARGERVNTARVTVSDVLTMRARSRCNEPTQAIAHDYGLPYLMIWRIVTYRSWAHLP